MQRLINLQPGSFGWRGTVLSLVVIVLTLLCNGFVTPNQVEASPAAARQFQQFRYVEATGHGISGSILRLYTRTGGETRHGKPLSEPVKVKTSYLQYFERSIIEFQPEYSGTGEEVRLLPLGQLVMADKNLQFQPQEPFSGQPDKWYFAQSGFSLAEPFLTFWRNQGEADGLGLPLSPEVSELAPDGTKSLVQYFEFARLQRPDNNQNQAEITISNLGAERARQQLKPAQVAAIPRERFNAPRTLKIPSLMFHYARVVVEKRDPLGYALSITPDNYVKYLDWMQTHGYNTVTTTQLLDYLKYGIMLPENPVNIRWDDGHDNNWFVYQEMKKRGMTATFYIISQRLELTPAQWKQISDDGFEVAPHTRTHPDLRGVRDLAAEITGSKQDLEAMLGRPARTFAYPYGQYNDTIKRVVRESGFELALSTIGGYTWNLDQMYEQPVVSVTGYDTVQSFADKIQRAYPPLGSSNNSAKPVIPAAPVPVAPAPKK